ncbi:MAG: sulfotransferase [Gammaproteobacteria bacterium]|nr:sulfotransferase [Gammaproteobacteria bacterium]
MANEKNIIILSEKSSGSSACQNLLAKFADVQHVSKTRHYENETLYWTKAASILDLHQLKMVDSEVPLEPEKARADLIALMKDNVDDYIPANDNKELIMQGWKHLCKKHSPIFLEKSPHHLCQWSAIELILEFINEVDDVDVLLIGLIRNPMDTIYSQYSRWKSPPDKVEQQWIVAYENLLKLQGILGKQLVVIRYEDMVSSLETMKPVFGFCGVSVDDADETYFHQKSLQKWKHDKLFGFSLSNEAVELAEKYGYQRDELINETHPLLWQAAWRLSRTAYRTSNSIKKLVWNIRKKTATNETL